jgi:diketogulonate reductase-like aldo/keto reductase
VPYFPLGGFSPLQSDMLSSFAARLDATPMAVALAWLLQRSPNILLIPGTSSVEHLRENVAGAGLQLPDDVIKELDDIARCRCGRDYCPSHCADLAPRSLFVTAAAGKKKFQKKSLPVELCYS